MIEIRLAERVKAIGICSVCQTLNYCVNTEGVKSPPREECAGQKKLCMEGQKNVKLKDRNAIGRP